MEIANVARDHFNRNANELKVTEVILRNYVKSS